MGVYGREHGMKLCPRCQHRLGDHVPHHRAYGRYTSTRVCDVCGCGLAATLWLSFMKGGKQKWWQSHQEVRN